MKKLTIHTEVAYIVASAILSFAVAILTKANLGVSMIVAPAFIVSEAIPLTFGQTEYVLQGVLFIVLCIATKKFKLYYLGAFVTTIIYGAMLDGWIALFDFQVTSIYVRVGLMVAGIILTSISIAIFFRCYFPPQVYDFFVKEVSKQYNIKREKFKQFFDLTFLVIAIVLSFAIFHKFHGIGVATVIATFLNALLINTFGKVLDKTIKIKPAVKKLEKWFVR